MVGLSADPMRPSHFAAIYMQSEGYDIIPVNPRLVGQEILGQTGLCIAARYSEGSQSRDRRCLPQAADVPAVLDEAIEIGAPVFWMQLGIVNEEAAARARAAGMDVVMNRCVKIEHARFFGGLNLVGMNTGVITSRRSIG